jgi:hypothetical protein
LLVEEWEPRAVSTIVSLHSLVALLALQYPSHVGRSTFIAFHPGTALPRWIVSYMLGVAAAEHRRLVVFGISIKISDLLFHLFCDSRSPAVEHTIGSFCWRKLRIA